MMLQRKGIRVWSSLRASAFREASSQLISRCSRCPCCGNVQSRRRWGSRSRRRFSTGASAARLVGRNQRRNLDLDLDRVVAC